MIKKFITIASYAIWTMFCHSILAVFALLFAGLAANEPEVFGREIYNQSQYLIYKFLVLTICGLYILFGGLLGAYYGSLPLGDKNRKKIIHFDVAFSGILFFIFMVYGFVINNVGP